MVSLRRDRFAGNRSACFGEQFRNRILTSGRLFLLFSGILRKPRVGRCAEGKPMFNLHLKQSEALPLSPTFTDHRISRSDTEDLISLFVNRLRTHSRR